MANESKSKIEDIMTKDEIEIFIRNISLVNNHQIKDILAGLENKLALKDKEFSCKSDSANDYKCKFITKARNAMLYIGISADRDHKIRDIDLNKLEDNLFKIYDIDKM